MKWYFFLFILLLGFQSPQEPGAWVRVNQLGYKMQGIKVAVFCSKQTGILKEFRLVDVITGATVYTGRKVENFGGYGPFAHVARLDFSDLDREGRFVIQAGGVSSPEFTVAQNAYKGAADFCLKYMRQQRSGFNPFLKDSCHTHDGYVLYGAGAGIKDSTHIDVSGGWHDASDYLQYGTTSANATYHLLMAARDFPDVFPDTHKENGLPGQNGRPDVLDEAKWGLDWLLKMHPRPDWLFNQLGDDRDHMGMRIPKEDTFYGKGFERPVYFASGQPQQRGKFMNTSTGTASIAGKYSAAFHLGAHLFQSLDPSYSSKLENKGQTALAFGQKQPGYSQTASVKSPYIYTEMNWMDDMELAYINAQYRLSRKANTPLTYQQKAIEMAKKEPVTPWLGKDTATHYQWYPFVNVGHYELAKRLTNKDRALVVGYMKDGIDLVWQKAKKNGFYYGIPFIWCSNNLTVAFATQCYWYRELTGDTQYAALEQACFDWIFGVNPWGTSMVYGLPAWGDTPVDPHSAFTKIKGYPIDGGLVDGPVYTKIFNSLIGITLYNKDAYAEFQSDLAVYHDDYGDYSTNEPTMDGTASLIYLLAAKEAERFRPKK